MKESDYIQMREEAIRNNPKGKPLTASGAEIPCPIPMAPPPGFKKQPSMFEEMRRLIREDKVRAALEAEGLETPEEADDFDVEDEADVPHSPYEHNFDPVADPRELERLRNIVPANSPSVAPSTGPVPPGGSTAAHAQATPNPPPATPSSNTSKPAS